MRTEFTDKQFDENIKNTEIRIKTAQDEELRIGYIKYKRLLEDARELGHAIWLGNVIARKKEKEHA